MAKMRVASVWAIIGAADPQRNRQILPEMTSPPDAKPSDLLRTALWIAGAVVSLALIYALLPVLTPFLLAGILAYICNPATDRLARWGMPRIAAALLVITAVGAVSAGLVLIILPMLYEEAAALAQRIPEGLNLLKEKVAPWLQQHLGVRLRLDSASLQKLATGNTGTVQAILGHVFNSLKIGGMALVGLAVNLMLVPVVMFYLMLDWHGMMARIDKVIPRQWHAKVSRMANDIDAVLSQYLRGQLLVMALLAAYYSIALWIADISSALSIGVLTGLLAFIPYLGFGTGLVLAVMVAALQASGWGPLIAVAIVYGIGQALETFVLTPYLVGERIGMHPLAVIFALMAFGQIFGFFGILVALPASAALAIGLRELRTTYLASRFYQGN